MVTEATRQVLTTETREAALAAFTSYLKNLDEAAGQKLVIAFLTRVLPNLTKSTAPLATVTIEVIESDSGTLPQGFKPTENWREGQVGRRSFTYDPVTGKLEGGIIGTEYRRRAKAINCGGTLREAQALARHLNEHQRELDAFNQFVFGLQFAFMESEVEDEDGFCMVAFVHFHQSRGGDHWIVNWDYLDNDYWDHRVRPLRPYS